MKMPRIVGLLAATSAPDRTSPIHRGRWVQEGVLCIEAPPPPENLQDLIVSTSASLPPDATVKERMTQHQNAAPACKACHQYMDPIGLGLEGFRAVAQTDPGGGDIQLIQVGAAKGAGGDLGGGHVDDAHWLAGARVEAQHLPAAPHGDPEIVVGVMPKAAAFPRQGPGHAHGSVMCRWVY